MTYDVDYFINKFSAIPEEKWVINNAHSKDGKKHCAYGHCGANGAAELEGQALAAIAEKNDIQIADINDGDDPKYQQKTPKQRILAALYDIKKLQPTEEKVKEIIRYVAIDADIRKETKELELIEN